MQPDWNNPTANTPSPLPPNRSRQAALVMLPILGLVVVAVVVLLVVQSRPAAPGIAAATSPAASTSAQPTGNEASSPDGSVAPTSSQPPASNSPFPPSPETTATPAAPDRLVLKWINPPGASGLEGLTDIRGSATYGDRYVIVGSRDVLDADPNPDRQTHGEPAIWWSDNATTWHVATLPDGYVDDNYVGCCVWGVVAATPGFVAAGEGLPLWSTDGEVWTQGTGDVLPYSGRVSEIGASPAGIVAYGIAWDANTPVARVSNDGMHWSDAPAVAQVFDMRQVDFVGGGGDLYAFVTGTKGKTAVYRMESVNVWQERATINDYIFKAVYGPNGWLAIGQHAWLSGHGANWTDAGSAPTPDALIASSAGYVAGTVTGPGGCTIDLSESTGHTWTSIDGTFWRKMKADWPGRWLNAFFIVDRRLVGVGQAHDDGQYGFVRTADLPAQRPGPGPTPSPTPVPTSTPTPEEGCGG
jgi:hypothetical protein